MQLQSRLRKTARSIRLMYAHVKAIVQMYACYLH